MPRAEEFLFCGADSIKFKEKQYLRWILSHPFLSVRSWWAAAVARDVGLGARIAAAAATEMTIMGGRCTSIVPEIVFLTFRTATKFNSRSVQIPKHFLFQQIERVIYIS